MRQFFTIYFVVITDLLYGHLWILITEFLKGHFLYVYQIGKNNNGVSLSTLGSKIHVLFFLQVLSLKCYLSRTIVFYWNGYIGNTSFLGQIRSKKILPPLSSRMRAFALLGETWPMKISCLRVTDMTLKEALSVNIYTRSNSSKWIWTPSNPIWYREELQMHSNILLLRQKFWCNYLQNWQLISLNIINSCE